MNIAKGKREHLKQGNWLSIFNSLWEMFTFLLGEKWSINWDNK